MCFYRKDQNNRSTYIIEYVFMKLIKDFFKKSINLSPMTKIIWRKFVLIKI